MVRNILLLSMALALLASSAAASSIVTNGSFSSDAFSPWVDSNCAGCTGLAWQLDNVSAMTGAPATYAAGTGCVGAACLNSNTGSTLTQGLTTTESTTYYLTFWYYAAGHQGTTLSPSEVDVYWNGTDVGSFVNETFSVWQEFTIADLISNSSLTTTGLEFVVRGDSGTQLLTDISVNAGDPPAPEPASLTLIGGGLLGIGALTAALRRRRKI